MKRKQKKAALIINSIQTQSRFKSTTARCEACNRTRLLESRKLDAEKDHGGGGNDAPGRLRRRHRFLETSGHRSPRRRRWPPRPVPPWVSRRPVTACTIAAALWGLGPELQRVVWPARSAARQARIQRPSSGSAVVRKRRSGPVPAVLWCSGALLCRGSLLPPA
ncbi:hypothetical protein BRADI_1g01693v3 [Brachypodium distachyon]|uniref:Uncharacterized protein n=1 Tax=Brachypodium distachyon TaxID=15368 RepID=A0A2K2DHN3_BRADI|nr:hypothetical protein BRADI_1g01693v3 [Brachypodium distachyon]